MSDRRKAFVTGKLLFGMTVPLAGISLITALAPIGGIHPARPRPVVQAGAKPTNSGPLALTHNDQFLWVANPDNNSVSLFQVGGDINVKVRELKVGAEPQCVAVSLNDSKVYVTNMVAGTVSVINTATQTVVKSILVGTEPFGCALTPDGTKLYVANFSSDTVSVISTATDTVIRTIALPASNPKPRGIAINTDGTVYVTGFLAQLRAGGVEGADDGKEGHVTLINSATDTVSGTVTLNPITNTGFNSNGSALDRINSTNPATFTFVTGAFPNLLQGLAIKGGKVYLTSTGSSPNGPFRFNVNVQSLLPVIDTATNTDVGNTLNMNRGIQFLPAPGTRLFPTNPIAIAFKNGANEGFVVSAASNALYKVSLDGSGVPTINAPTGATDPGNVIRTDVGKNPQGIVINSTDTRAYVMNYISRDVTAIDISPTTPVVIGTIPSAALPTPGTLEAALHRGHELFNTSIGPAGTDATAQAPAGRMSDTGWGSCYSCHPNGLTDGVTWIFPDGPRQSISMESTGEHPQPPTAQLNGNFAPVLPAFHQRVLNWSAVRDEVQDFELNIRAVSGGQGLIQDGQAVVNLTPTANTGRSADLDNLAAYVTMGIRAPISPFRPKNVGPSVFDPDIISGRALFNAANCQQCHGGPNWTRSTVNFTPPPLGEPITGGQLVSFLRQVGTFNPTDFNEVRFAGDNVVGANGMLGFNIPSLVSVFAGAPYLHSGGAPTLDDVMANVTHRSSGTGGVDTLTNPADRARIVKFLRSIDAKTPTFP
jgi:YVTN family beta-propeller protein